MKRPLRKVRGIRREGCGFLLLTCLFSCFFLILNAALVTRLYPLTFQQLPLFENNPRLHQLVMFLGPVSLLFFEWWVVDRVVDLLTPRGDGDDASSSGA